MKNKRGFTMIELIICITLIVVIGTSSIIIFNNKDEEKEKQKNINSIIATADVYYSSNTELKQKLKDNYGYYVVKIDTLKDLGYISMNHVLPTLSEEEKQYNRDYSKIVIVDIDEETGIIDYIYPYYQIKPFITALNDLNIEYEEKDSFKCSSGLKDGKLAYLNEDYEIVYNDNYKCSTSENSGYVSKDDNLSLNEGNNTIYYKTTVNGEDIKAERIVYVNPQYNIKLVGRLENINGANYNCGEWTNKDFI